MKIYENFFAVIKLKAMKYSSMFEEMDDAEARYKRNRREAAANTQKKQERREAKAEANRKRAGATNKPQPPPPPLNATRAHLLYSLGLSVYQDTPLHIKAAFRRMALLYHPDKNKAPGSAARFREARAAYEKLMDLENTIV